jgi:hypothetical protein
MATIAEVIGWKFNNQPGMRCSEDVGGNLVITEFPGGIPSQVDQDVWTAEYNAHMSGAIPHELDPLQFDAFMDELGTNETAAIAACDLVYDTVPARKRAKRYIRKSPVYNRADARINKVFSDDDPDGLGFTHAQIDAAWLAVKDENGV